MEGSFRLDDARHTEAIGREIDRVRTALGRSSKLRELFDYLVDRSRIGTPPREIEIAQDVFGRTAQAGDDGGARVYVHRLRRRLEELNAKHVAADLRLMLPLGEYRLVAAYGAAVAPDEEAAPPTATVAQPMPWRFIAIGAAGGIALSLLLAFVFLSWPTAQDKTAAQARRSAVWAPLFANGRSVIVAEGDHYLFGEKGADGNIARIVRDYRIHDREQLDAYLLGHPAEADRFVDVGQAYVPVTVPRAQQYLAPILAANPGTRVLPASQVPASAMLSQNIVYLGLTSGLGPLDAPVSAGSRFRLDRDSDTIHDTKTRRSYGAGRTGGTSPRRQYGLVSLFAGKEGNRFVVMAGTSEMGLVGLVETLADPDRLRELATATQDKATVEALYEVDSQGAGVLAVRLIAVGTRPQARVWAP